MTSSIYHNQAFMHFISKLFDLVFVNIVNLFFWWSSINQEYVTVLFYTMIFKWFLRVDFEKVNFALTLCLGLLLGFGLFWKHVEVTRQVVIVELSSVLGELEVHLHPSFRQLLILILLLIFVSFRFIHHDVQSRKFCDFELI